MFADAVRHAAPASRDQKLEDGAPAVGHRHEHVSSAIANAKVVDITEVDDACLGLIELLIANLV